SSASTAAAPSACCRRCAGGWPTRTRRCGGRRPWPWASWGWWVRATAAPAASPRAAAWPPRPPSPAGPPPCGPLPGRAGRPPRGARRPVLAAAARARARAPADSDGVGRGARGGGAGAGRLPRERGARLCGRVADRLVEALVKETDANRIDGLADGLAAVGERL